MTIRLTALLIVLTIFGCALLASYQHSEQPLRIDAANTIDRPHVMMCRLVDITLGPDDPKPITRT